MSNNRLKQLSAFVDNEVGDAESQSVVGHLTEDASLRATWARYQLIGDAIRDELIYPPDVLSQRISNALADEPTVLAPRGSARAWLRPAGGLAIAASVAAVAVLGLQRASDNSPQTPVAPIAAVEAPTTIPVVEAPVTVEFVSGSPARLNGYLVNHHERTRNVGMQGIMPYVQMVGYTPAE